MGPLFWLGTQRFSSLNSSFQNYSSASHEDKPARPLIRLGWLLYFQRWPTKSTLPHNTKNHTPKSKKKPKSKPSLLPRLMMTRELSAGNW